MPTGPPPIVFHDPDDGRPARRSTSASAGREYQAHRAAAHRRAARGGPPAGLRRADARQAPGGGVVGRLVGQPQLAARPPAVRARAPTAPSPRVGRGDADRRRGDRALPRAGRRGAGLHQRRALGARAAGRVGRPARRAGRPRRRALRPRARLGLAPHVLQRHHRRRPTRPASPASRRRPSSRTSRRSRGRRGRCRRRATAATPRAVPSLLADLPAGVHVGTLVHRVLEATDFDAPDLDAALADAGRRGPGPAPRRGRRSGRAGRRAARRSSRRRSGRCSAARACATSPRADRLDELEFELPLAGGDTPAGRVTLAADRATSCASTSRRAIRWPATRSAWTTPRCVSASGAT